MKKRFWKWVAYKAPKELLYFCVIRTWAIATTQVHTDKTPDEVNWHMACKCLNVE